MLGEKSKLGGGIMRITDKLSNHTKKLLKIFMISSAITFTVCLLIVGAGVLAYNTLIYQEEPVKQVQEDGDLGASLESNNDHIKPLDQEINKTVAIFGTDVEGYRTDTILVANFNSKTNEAKIISVPRDTRVEWTDAEKQYLNEGHEWVNASKLNEMTVHTGLDQIRGGTIDYLEKLLGLKIDNYVIVSTSAFRELIDAVGGVEIDVPVRMKKDDYSQDLHIDLYPGVQVLDGAQAEGFVRYRDYKMGDIDRISAQQAFIEAFVEKIMSPEIITKIPSLITIMFTSVKTDVKIAEIPQYYPYIKGFDTNNLSFYTVPGDFARIDNGDYYIVDREATYQMIDDIFFAEEE